MYLLFNAEISLHGVDSHLGLGAIFTSGHGRYLLVDEVAIFSYSIDHCFSLGGDHFRIWRKECGGNCNEHSEKGTIKLDGRGNDTGGFVDVEKRLICLILNIKSGIHM